MRDLWVCVLEFGEGRRFEGCFKRGFEGFHIRALEMMVF